MKKLITILILVGAAASLNAKLGDTLYVSVDGAALRSSPSDSASMVASLPAGNELLEFKREGSWVNVGAVGTGGKDGWLKLSQVSTTRQVAKPAAAKSGNFKQFHANFVRFSMMLKIGAGDHYFGDATPKGDGIIDVEVTGHFLSRPKKIQEGLLNSLVELWVNEERPGLPVWIHLVDDQGKVLMKGGLN